VRPRSTAGGRTSSAAHRATGVARIQILAGAVLWGTTGTAQAFAPKGASPLAIASTRVALGGLTLVVLAAGRWQLKKLQPKPVAVGAACLVVAQLCFFSAVERTGVAVGTVVAIGSAPLAAGALGWWARAERPGVRWAVATLLGVGGCMLLLTGGRSIDVDATGVGLALVVGVGYAGYTLATKDLIAHHSPDAVTAAVFAVAAVCMVPVLVRVDLAWAAQPRGFAIVAHLGVLTVGLAYSLFARGLTLIPAAPAVTLTLAEPLTAGILGVVVLDESLTPPAATGIALMLAGLVLLAWPERGPQAQSPSATTMGS
jgi:drug/metabolite transporter, DME family